ncbi:MAG: TIGR03915 family putative DNA repair protein [Clostridia bacterium]|nr:TIGR03915 family putative DNA repair protein [Clostridia bacterium]
MINYVFDGSFEGLLTSVYEAYYCKEPPQKILWSRDLQENLFESYIHIETDHEKSQKVYHSVLKKISYPALQNAYYTYLSEHPDSGTFIYRYLKFGFKVGGKVDQYLTDERVLTVHTLRRKVALENHRLLGLLRFRKLSGDIYYAPIEPDFNIVGLLAPHFVKRLSSQNFVIHDKKRCIGAVFDQNDWYLTDIPNEIGITLDHSELDFQGLWKRFFKSISIEERTHPKLQKSFMPKRYWKYLVEKEAGL